MCLGRIKRALFGGKKKEKESDSEPSRSDFPNNYSGSYEYQEARESWLGRQKRH